MPTVNETLAVPGALVLASASPRRRELLATLGVPYTVVPADIDESVMPDELPADYVRRMAVSKAQVVAAGCSAAIVLGSDTAVVVHGKILGKPADRADGLAMLAQLADSTHQVYTAVALVNAGDISERISITEVGFRAIAAPERAAYWATGEPADKAGGYAIQGLGAVFVREIQGSYSGVVGLPIYETAELLTAAGFQLIVDGDERRNTD
jgi:septum formation protein